MPGHKSKISFEKPKYLADLQQKEPHYLITCDPKELEAASNLFPKPQQIVSTNFVTKPETLQPEQSKGVTVNEKRNVEFKPVVEPK